MKTKIRLSTVIAAALLVTTVTSANDEVPKQALKTNYQLVYSQKPKQVDNFAEMFKEGIFYGRLRSNTFMYKWEEENKDQKDHYTSGLGGSLVYQSAIYNDFDFRGALYYSHGFTNLSEADIKFAKPGQDVLSRFDYSNTGNQNMSALGQAYIRYSGLEKSDITVGRQLVETFYTASNDTKMIPNVFDGIVFNTTLVSKTPIKLAYLAKEKLRAHTDTHSVLAWGDASSSSSLNPSWDQNDDSAMHKGLTYTKLKDAGKEDAPLITGDIQNTSIENLKLNTSFYVVPELVSEIMAEANYKINMDGFSLSPGVRYIKQFDNGAGEIGGAAINGKLVGKSGAFGGYKDASSLDSQMIAARLVGAYKNFKLNLGYSQVMDEADLVTPWRGFPTAGYTRSMARYNWVANTKSYRAELTINPNKTGVYKDVAMQLSALHTDADENKGQFDENFYYAGFVQNLPMMPELQWRLRLGYTDTDKVDADSLDARFELNYLF
ncbi:hypothetical protein [Sulfurimonas sp.]|uniref:hypothetical protein n=1 Tax=Sulfurimonas sp. TaxID=2022749 RepID=UPI0025F898D2|nr:hypothetical protein [Sulfurimonas sp.]